MRRTWVRCEQVRVVVRYPIRQEDRPIPSLVGAPKQSN